MHTKDENNQPPKNSTSFFFTFFNIFFKLQINKKFRCLFFFIKVLQGKDHMIKFVLRTAYSLSIAFLFLASNIAFAKQFNEIIAFGDSLTDVGNVAGITVPGAPPRIPGYFLETHFSDNVIWIEYLANYLGLPARTPGRGTTTTLPPLPMGNTWAWGGSEAAFGSVQPLGVTAPIPNLLTEVSQYLSTNIPNSKTLYSIWSGADNLLVGGNFGPQAAEDAVSAVIIALKLLQEAGARQFLVFNMPQLGDTPAALLQGPFGVLIACEYTAAYNTALKRALKDLHKDSSFTGTIYFVNVFKEIVKAVKIVNKGGTYRPSFFVPGPPVAVNNVTNEGLQFFNVTHTFPTNYLFWDDVHPTTQAHQVIAGLVLRAIR
jgi:phospholipase/lecithinase/hemolysin